MDYVLAVDGGGSKTQAVCADLSGKELGVGISGPTSLTATSIGAASFNLREALRQATESLPAGSTCLKLVMGLAGMDTPDEEKTAQEVFQQSLSPLGISSLQLVNDSAIALANGTDALDSVVLISGTGSNCFGKNQAGQTAKTGGYDYILSDQGSGYAIGRAVLRQAIKSYDGRGQRTILEQFVCDHFKITDLSHLKTKVHNPILSKTEIAELAQVCLRAYSQADVVATAIFDHAVEELVLMTSTVIRRLDLAEKPVVCVLAGSITKISHVETELKTRLTTQFPQITMTTPETPPVHGALKMALATK